MSLELAARHLAAQGRGPDKNLVHMSPREVAGLQALAMAHGGSLSINPKTGLPEAGFLDRMLPMLIGVGITAATGGAAAPWMVGLGLGGFEAARTGNLSKGLMAGLGAYGGAGLAGGLMAAGAGTAAGTAGAANTAANAAAMESMGSALAQDQAAAAALSQAGGAEAANAAAMESMGSALAKDQAGAAFTVGTPMPNPSLMAQPTYIPPFGAGAGAGAEGTLGELQAQQALRQAPAAYSNPDFFAGADYARSAATAPATPMPEPVDAVRRLSPGDMALRQQPTPTFGSRLGQMGQGLKGLTTTEGRDAFMSEVGKGKGLMKYGAAAGLPLLMTEPKPLNVPGSGPNPYRYRFEAGRIENPEDVTGERRYFDPRYIQYAAGGPVEDMSAANVYSMQNARGGVADMGIDNSTGMQRMASGGVSHLGDYSDGGRLLKGPGDGVSDSIPAVIGNKQPARLADGEFVVPARIVSELGNGSTEAGARKLYAMMDRIQKARGKTTGKNRVAANTRSDKYLPA